MHYDDVREKLEAFNQQYNKNHEKIVVGGIEYEASDALVAIDRELYIAEYLEWVESLK